MLLAIDSSVGVDVGVVSDAAGVATVDVVAVRV